MSEMVERVARALCRRYEIEDGFSVEQADRAAAGEMHKNFLTATRDALMAAREPTEAIKKTVLSSRMTECWDYDDLGQIWRELVDAALKE